MRYRSRCLLTLALSLPAFCQDAVVWRIGSFDHTWAEFTGQTGDRPVVVDADAADAAARWPSQQYGTLNAKSAPESHARTIEFRLKDAPSGSFVLDFAVMAANPRTPHLELDLNGAPASVYLDRRLSYHAEGRADSPIGAEARVRIPVPAGVLRQGANTLRITAVDSAPDQNGDSRFGWDALALLRTAQGEAGVAVEPAYFFADQKELVTVTVTLAEVVRSGEATLSLGGATHRAPLAPGRFGQQRFEFWVPEFAAESDARVAVKASGKTLQWAGRLSPKRKLTVYIVPSAHLDIGFTDYQPKVEELHSRNVDRLLEEMRGDPGVRYSLDGAWIAERYLRTRSPEAQRELMDAVRAGRISIPAQQGTLMIGGTGLETLIRSLYAGRALNGAAGRKAEYANSTDVPAHPWAYASVLSAAGVKRFAASANYDRGPQPLIGRWQTRSPFWWQGPDGAKVLMAYTRQYSHLWFICGMPASEASCRDSLPTFFQTFESPASLPDTVLMFGTQPDNVDLVPGAAEFVRQWNGKYAWPRLELATFHDYFERIEKEYGDKLPTVRGDFGPYWEDGVATDARHAALYRQTESRAQAVETLAALASLQRPQWAAPLDRLSRMWQSLVLYAEHTYTSSGGYSRPETEHTRRQTETKRFNVMDAKETAHWVAQQSFSRLMDSIRISPSAFVVFNSLPRERSGLVEMDVPEGMALVDADGQTVATETVGSGYRFRRVRFLAARVPPLGYRVYKIENRETANAPAPAPGDIVENAFYRVTVNAERGGITSVFDKQMGRELVDPQSPYLLGQYLYVSGGEGTRLINVIEHLPAAKLTVAPSGGARAVNVAVTPWGRSLSYQVSGPHAPEIAVEVRLFDGEKKIEIVNRVKKEPVRNKEAVYFAFPFAAADPQFEYEGQTGTVNPARDALAGACREWFAVGRWARVAGGGVSAAVIPLDAPLVTFGDINRGLWPEKFEPRSSAIFSYAMTNYWHTNFPRIQSGDHVFRYVLTSGAELTPAVLSRLGRESMTPLEVGELRGNDKLQLRGWLPETSASFLSLSGDGVEMEALKPAEDGNGQIVRLRETAGRASKARLSSSLLRIERAWLSNALEDDQRELAAAKDGIEIELGPYSITTLRLVLRPVAP